MDLRYRGGALWRQRLLVAVVLVITTLAVAAEWLVSPQTYTVSGAVALTPDPSYTGTTGPSGTTSTSPSALDSASLDRLRSDFALRADSVETAATISRTLADEGVRLTSGQLQESVDIHAVMGSGLLTIMVSAPARDTAVAVERAAEEAMVGLARGGPLVVTLGAAPVTTRGGGPGAPVPVLIVALGLVLAVGAAGWRDRRSPGRLSADGLERWLQVPTLARLRVPPDPSVLPAMDRGTRDAGAFRRLGSRLGDSLEGRGGALVVAGTVGDLGSCWLAANLAVAMADQGERVLLVDARHVPPTPMIARPVRPGLSDVLDGTALEAAVAPGPVEGVSLLGPGRFVVGSSESAWSGFWSVVLVARATYDVVLVVASALDAGDAAVALSQGGALVLTVRQDQVSSERLSTLAARLRYRGRDLLGAVLVQPTNGSDRGSIR